MRAAGLALLLFGAAGVAGCADREVAAGPESTPGTGTWVAVWVAAGLATVVLGLLLARGPGGARLAAVLLTVQAGASVVVTAVLAGLAIRSWPLADAKAAGEVASGTSLLNVSVIDGDPRFYSLMLLAVVVLGSLLALLLTMAARFARRDDVAERWTAAVVLGFELLATGYAIAVIRHGERPWPYVVVAAHLPLVLAALVTCIPRAPTEV